MRLNLGCGIDNRYGYVNVDFRKIPGVDSVVDLSVFPWPFSDGSAEEILMFDCLEHFSYRQTSTILSECWRVLSDGGQVLVQVPDGEHLMHAFAQSGPYLCNRCGGQMQLPHREEARSHCVGCGQSAQDISEAAMMRLYGGQDYTGNFHFICFSKQSLEQKAAASGLKLVAWEQEEHMTKNWSIFGRFMKGDPWAT